MDDLRRICVPVADLLRAPDGALDRQLLFGEAFAVTDQKGMMVFGTRPRDGYEGWVSQDALKGWAEPTHRVCALGAHVYADQSIKTRPLCLLPYQAEITIVDEQGAFLELAAGGFVHHQQVEPISVRATDPASVCETYLNVPYLWGGNSQFGIDCSGLVSAGFWACGKSIPGDSGPQEVKAGTDLDADMSLVRNDLIFWKGHVGIMLDHETLLHANGHHMRTVKEPLELVVHRCMAEGVGPVTSRKRVLLDRAD